MKRLSVLLEWLEQFLEDWCSAWAAQVWTSWHRCQSFACFRKPVSDTYRFHASTRPVDGAKGIVFWIVPPLCNRTGILQPACRWLRFICVCTALLYSWSQVVLILSAWLTFLASYYNRLSSYHLHMITILVSLASVSLTYFVYMFVSLMWRQL